MKKKFLFQLFALVVLIVYVLLLFLIGFSLHSRTQDQQFIHWEKHYEKLLK